MNRWSKRFAKALAPLAESGSMATHRNEEIKMIRKAIEKTIPDLRRTYPLPSNVSDDHEMAVFDQAVCLADYVLHDVLDALDDPRGHDSDLSLDVHDEIVDYLTFG